MKRKTPIPEDFGLTREAIESTKMAWEQYVVARDKAGKTCERVVTRFALAGAAVGFVTYVCFMSKEFDVWRTPSLGHLFIVPFVLLLSLSCGCFFGGMIGAAVGYVPGRIISYFTPKAALFPELERQHDALEMYHAAVKDWEEYQERQEIQFWTKMDGWTFEHEMAKLYRSRGFDAEVTKGSGDGGVDILLRKGSDIQVVQCKQHKSAVSPAVVRELYGVLMHHRANRAILVSTGGFTTGAIEFARDKPIELVDLAQIVAMAREG